MNIYEILQEKQYELPPAPAKGGLYTQVMPFGDGSRLVYVSGCGCDTAEKTFHGKLGKDLTIEEGQEAAKWAALNLLAVLEANVGLDKVEKCVKLLSFVASDPTFYDQPAVANGGSQVMVDVFGQAPSRSAVGMVCLPNNLAIEIEGIFLLKE